MSERRDSTEQNKKKKKASSISRRSILRKSAAGAGLSVAGLAQPVFAQEDTDEDELGRLEALPEVQSILRELGLNEIPNGKSAKTTEVEGSTDVAVTEVELDYGTLQIGEFDGETNAAFTFDAENSSNTPEELSGVPSEADAWLIGSETGAVFVRTATEGERDAILSSVPAEDTETTLVYTRSDIDGFHVDVLDPIDDHETPVEAGVTTEKERTDSEFVRYEVSAADEDSSMVLSSTEIEPETISGPAREVARQAAIRLGFESVDHATDTCGVPMTSCALGILTDIPSCLRCAPACTAGMGISGGAICFLCVFGVCSWMLTGRDCINAVRCVN